LTRQKLNPPPVAPRLVSVSVAASYCGLSPNSFLARVDQHLFPAPVTAGRRKLWDMRALDAAIDAMAVNGAQFDPERLGDIQWGGTR
jgi:hypothetical protein